MKSVVDWFARNGVAANLLLVVILACGAIVLGDLKQEITPEFSLEIVTVSIEYRGASPVEVEKAICLRVEEALQNVEGVKRMTTVANEGRAAITLELLTGSEVRKVLEDVKTSVDAIDTFPDAVEKPVVQELTSRRQVVNVAIAGETDLATLKRIGEEVRDGLTALPEISHAELFNVPLYEISIEVSEEALRRWGLTFDMVANAVRLSSVDMPAGSVKTESGEILFRTRGQASSGQEFESLPMLTQPDGTRIYIRDVATVIDGFEDLAVSARFNGDPAVLVQVFRVGEQSAIEVSRAARAFVDRASENAPAGIEISIWQDRALDLESRVALLVENAFWGLALVFILLALFMRPRLAFWVTIGIPVSFLGAIALMPVLDVSINMFSLFSFILVLGIVVDDAIVVGENIHATRMRTGKGISAAVRGTHEVLLPVTFGVLTTMAAFVPMLFVTGILGKVVVVFPLIILPTLFFSLVESSLILPSHLAHGKRPAAAANTSLAAGLWNGFFDLFSDGLDWIIRRAYRPLLRGALEWRYLTIAVALFTVLLTAGLIGSGAVRLMLMPPAESNNVVAFLAMPREAPVESTRVGIARLERTALELRREFEAEDGQDPVAHVLTSVGEHPYRAVRGGPSGSIRAEQGEYLGEVHLELLPSELRRTSAEEIADRWRKKVGRIPGAVEASIEHDLFGLNKPIDLQLSGPDLDEVREAAEFVKAELAAYPGVVDITDTYRAGKPEIDLSLTSEGEAVGLTLRGLGRQVRQGFFGEEVQRVQRNREDMRVMVRYPRGDRGSLGDLERIRVRTPSGREVPFSTVATASIARGPASITRVDRQRSISVQAGVDLSVTTSEEVLDALEGEFLPNLVSRYPDVTWSIEGDQAAYDESLDGMGRGFAVIVIVMFGMLAIPLKSYLMPAIILSAIPFGMVGAVWGHAILGLELSFVSLCGMVALAGVVVNDGLVLVAFINRNARHEATLRAAVQKAGEARFRAILLTSLTTSAGVTPLILERSLQAQFLIPMAVALASGVLFATLVTLVLVPSLFLVVDDLRSLARWLAGDTRARELRAAPVSGARDVAQRD